MQVELPILSLLDCQTLNNGEPKRKLESTTQICTGSNFSKSNETCSVSVLFLISKNKCFQMIYTILQGFGGGPQIIRNPQQFNQFAQVGIVSYGERQCGGLSNTFFYLNITS